MTAIKDAAREFLAHRRVAATGVSVQGNHGSNVVYKRLRDRGYEVFAVNPNAEAVEGDLAYHDLRSIPGGVEAVVIGTRPEIAEETMGEWGEGGAGVHGEGGAGWPERGNLAGVNASRPGGGRRLRGRHGVRPGARRHGD